MILTPVIMLMINAYIGFNALKLMFYKTTLFTANTPLLPTSVVILAIALTIVECLYIRYN